MKEGVLQHFPTCLQFRFRRPCRTWNPAGKSTAQGHLRRRPRRKCLVQCFGGIILSNIFRKDSNGSKDDLNGVGPPDCQDDDSDVIVLQEVESPVTGGKTQIAFCRDATVETAALSSLLQKVGWPDRAADRLETALQGSYLVSTMVRRDLDADGSVVGEEMIGLIRCTSDRVFNATIWDVLVDPGYQGKGIGRYMVTRTVESLKRKQIGNICLFADREAVGFYEQLGFKCDPDGVRGMFWNQRI